MHKTYRNINDGFRDVVAGIASRHFPVEESTSRNGPVLRIAEPIILTFTSPQERVLFNTARDVNPFSLLYEAGWTLAGRNDVAPLSYYTRRMTDYSDDGKTWHGAYGRRWRTWFDVDQLDAAVAQLRKSPDSRRVVLAMWDARTDGNGDGLDYPCNSHAYVTVRNGRLNLTVCNRSNDLIWGTFGANYVVFSFLLEYLASRVGVPMGVYHHVSNDAHVYTETNSGFKPDEWLRAADSVENFEYGQTICGGVKIAPFPLVKDPAAFEAELPAFVEHHSGTVPPHEQEGTWDEPFLQEVAGPLLCAFACHKAGDTHSALMCVEGCAADDWRLAGMHWLKRRAK